MHFSELPKELKLQIFLHLPVSDLLKVGLVSKGWHELSFDGILWREFDSSPSSFSSLLLHKILTKCGSSMKTLVFENKHDFSLWQINEVAISFGSLETLKLRNCSSINNSVISSILRNNKGIKFLSISCMGCANNTTCAEIANHCQDLQFLDLSFCQNIDFVGITMIEKGCTNIKKIIVSQCHQVCSWDLVLSAFPSFPQLQSLDVSGCMDDEHSVLRETQTSLFSIHSLKSLCISRCHEFDSDVFQNILPALENLERFEAASTNLNDAQLISISNSADHLTHIDCENCSELTDFALLELSRSSSAKSLIQIELSGCDNVTDSGVLALIRSCPSLKWLSLDNTNVSNEALEAICTRCNHLEQCVEDEFQFKVTVYDCIGVTWNGIQAVLDMNERLARNSKGLIVLKCQFAYQKLVDTHTKALLNKEFDSAEELKLSWILWMRNRRLNVFEAFYTEFFDQSLNEILQDEQHNGFGLSHCLQM